MYLQRSEEALFRNMLDEDRLRDRLPIGWIGDDFFYYQTVGSTSSEAVQLAESGAPHGTLVLADSQTAGVGRGGRQWITLPGAALAFSLILRPSHLGADQWLRLFGLGAVSVAETLSGIGLRAEIKWPNDLLIAGKKVAGILVNSTWTGERVDYSVLGIGLNITPEAIPDDALLDFPAISVEKVLGHSIEREDLLIAILANVEAQYEKFDKPEFMDDWQSKLAYLDQEVVITKADGDVTGKLIGLTPKGELKLITTTGRELVVDLGDIRLRPISKSESEEKTEGLSSQ
jgi:BirA family biotin operon repressor/biotin-[acetyl-CoA-carboxylase] ligase